MPACAAQRRRAKIAGRAMALALALTAGLNGCAWRRSANPVSDALVESRQLSSRGVAALKRGQREEGERLLAQAVEVCGADPESRGHYAAALMARGEHAEALVQLDEAIRIDGENPELIVRRAELHRVLGATDLAVRGAERALDLEPQCAAAWALRARSLAQMGYRRQALGDYQRALGLAPEDRGALFELARLYLDLDAEGAEVRWRSQQALAAVQALLDTYNAGEEPRDVLRLAGVAYRRLNRNEEAAESFLAASLRGPPDAALLCELAESQWDAGRRQEALQSAHRALALAPRSEPALALWNRLRYETAGQPERSLR